MHSYTYGSRDRADLDPGHYMQWLEKVLYYVCQM